MEKQLLLEAGAELAAAGSYSSSLAFFGLKWIQRRQFASGLAAVPSWNLPDFMSPNEETLDVNDHLISTVSSMLWKLFLFEFDSPLSTECRIDSRATKGVAVTLLAFACQVFKHDGPCSRRLLLAFDRTYINRALQLCTTPKGQIMAGCAHRPARFELADDSQIVLSAEKGEEQFDLKQKARANEMESCLVWDATRPHSVALEIAAYPVLTAASLDRRFEQLAPDPTHQRGKWETLNRLGTVLAKASSVRYIVCDGHGSHEWLHRFLLGQEVAISEEVLQLLPFWRELEKVDLPPTSFPIGYRLVKYEGVSLHYFGGVAHIQKNFVEQLRSSLRTPTFGKKMHDASAALDLGLFPQSYIGSDAMSDFQAALWLLA